MSNFQRRHMEAVALAVSMATLHEVTQSDAQYSLSYKDGQRAMRAAIMRELELMFSKDNVNFDPMKFRDACLVK